MMQHMKKALSLLMLCAVSVALLCAPLATTARALENGDGEFAQPLNWMVTGPMGGDVRSLVVDPQDPQRLYFGTIDGQVYTSTDGGQTWARVAGFNRPGL